MFGLIVAGRLVNTSFREVDPTHVVVDVDDVGTFNHIVVFLTGQIPFPEGMGGAVYFSWPDNGESSDGATAWQFLGMISNQKPSAIFKVAKFKPQAVGEQSMSSKFQFQMQQNQILSRTAQVGISVEPLSLLEGLKQATTESEATLVPKFVEFTQKMVQSLFNFTSSYAVQSNEMKPSETYVPYSSIHQWCQNFERKIKLDPYYWTK